MKKYSILFCIALALTSIVAIAAPDDDYVIPFEQLPTVSQNFVKTNFDVATVAYCMRDAHSYEVRFSDASEIEFDHAGNWEEIDCKYKAVPESVIKLIPASAPAYVQTNFPSSLITKVKVKAWGYELELNTGLELEFNRKGGFLRIDD